MSKKIRKFCQKTLFLAILSMMLCASVKAEEEAADETADSTLNPSGKAAISIDGLTTDPAAEPSEKANGTAAEPGTAQRAAESGTMQRAAEPDTLQETAEPSSARAQAETAEEPASAQDIEVLAHSTSEYSVNVTGYNAGQGTFRAVVSGITAADKAREVLIPVWSKVNGQDDIIWYSARKSNNGDYYIDVDIRNHRYSMGTYYIHVYITDITGRQFFACSTEQEIQLTPGTLSVTKNNEKEYTIELTGVDIPGGVLQIQFPLWSKTNGQDDIVWYTASKVNSQVYRCRISVANHRGLGQFIVHAYARMPDHSSLFLGAGGFTTEAPSVGGITASVTDRTGGRFQIRISGVKNSGLIRQIQVPVWSRSNQSDIVWYTTSRDSKGDYIVNADISNHGYNLGAYHIHIYMTDVSGAQQFAGATACEMGLRYQSLRAEDISGIESAYRITLDGLSVPAGERNVQFAVWGAANGQNDIRWYTASRQSAGKYIYDVKTADHRESGRYIVHAYCNTRGNTLQFIGAAGFEVTKKALAAQVQVRSLSNTQLEIGIIGISARRVQFPTWSKTNGQDDIIWYEGSRKGNGEWSVIVNSANHRHSGEYVTHIYTDGAFAGSASYQLKKNGIEIADVIRNAGKPAGKTLYVWGGGWNEADTAAGETALTIGVYPEWERYFNSNRQGYSYLPGKRAWERGERQWRFYGLDCSGYLGWVVYNSVQSGRNGAGYVVDASRFASSLAGYGYGTVSPCTPGSVFKPGDIISISGHCYLSLGQCSDGSVLILHSTPNGGVQVSGTVSGGRSSEASRLASSFMQQNYPQWWASFGGEGRQSVDASKYLNGTKFSWTVNSMVGDSEGIQSKRANEILNSLL